VRIDVLCFALLRDIVGAPRLSLELPEGATVADALAALVALRPALAAATGSLRFAVSEEFVDAGRLLRSGDTLALIPPVSGG
jgi:molybdopterin synthase sulfur carrier subunit